MYFVAGQFARLGSLAVGFCLILSAAWLRSRGGLLRHSPFVLFTGGYFSSLVLLSKFQSHSIFYDRTQQIFVIVCICLFWAGYILAREKRQDFVSANQFSLVGVAAIAIVCLLAFLRFVKAVSFAGAERGFGESTLNPVGVAYANTCLALIFVVIGLFNREIWRKALFLIVAVLAGFIVVSTASRGALIWGVAAILFFLVLSRHRKYLSVKGLGTLIAGMCIVVPIALTVYHLNYAIAERVDILVGRFLSLFRELFTSSTVIEDGSVGAREVMWDFYISNIDQWLFFGEKNYVGYPHNQWLEIGVRFGFLGIPLLIMSIALGWRVCWDALTKKMHPDVEFSLITILFIYSYLQSMTSLSLQVNRALWLGFGYLLGYYIERSKRRRRA